MKFIICAKFYVHISLHPSYPENKRIFYSIVTCCSHIIYFISLLSSRITNFDISLHDLLNEIFTDNLSENEKSVLTCLEENGENGEVT